MRVAALACLLAPALLAAPEQPPLEIGLEERVEVQLVLVDLVVLDRRGTTVADLDRDDFELRVDGDLVRLATLDAFCPDGAVDDPRGRVVRAAEPAPTETRSARRKVVLAFDYFHIDSAAETLDAARRALEAAAPGNAEHMIVSLAETVRIESPFSPDTAPALAALERMRSDPALYAGNYGRLTERRFFDRVHVLFDLLERIDGRKAVVLFSGPFLPDGFHHDPAFRSLASLSARARASLYTVDTGGLRTPLDPAFGPLGGPAMLRRLAHETGGRPTADTNDLALAYDRARRDLGCTYTLGFYDRAPRPDRSRRVVVSVTRPRLRAVHAASYVIRSPEKKRRSLVRTASMAPGMFESAALRARLEPVRPSSSRRWETRVDVEIDRAALGNAEGDWELRGILRKPNGTRMRSFRRTVRLDGEAAAISADLHARPGPYTLSLVLTHPERVSPLTTSIDVELPAIPDPGTKQ